MARDKAVKEAISKGTVQSGDMESITKIRDSVKPIPLENLTIEVADHEDGASKVRRLESISNAREARWKKHNVCTRDSDATDQDVEETCSTAASRDQYPPQSQVQESASAGSENYLTSGSDVD